jgi:hypothetical protein
MVSHGGRADEGMEDEAQLVAGLHLSGQDSGKADSGLIDVSYILLSLVAKQTEVLVDLVISAGAIHERG